MSDRERCNICYLTIRDQATHLLCPRCLNSYHRDHLAAWLLNDTKCPVCREVLSEDFRFELKPKSERERRKLEQLMLTLDGLGDTLGDWETKHKKRLDKERRLDPNAADDNPSIRRLVIPLVLSVLWIAILFAVFG